jgi:uncharacterized membrane protein SpoIIM required for sporulation
MPERPSRSQRFRAAREAEWRRLDALLQKIDRGSAQALSTDELLAIPVLYRSTLSSLSVARATSLDRDLIGYLESLSARAYFFVYGPRTTLAQRAVAFFRRDWPMAVRAIWRETLISAALTLVGGILAYLLTHADADWFYAFVPQGMTEGRDPTATTAYLHQTLYAKIDPGTRQFLPAFATFLFTHNARIAIMAFALGFACCAPTAMLMVYSGAMAGAFFALYGAHGLGWQLGGWLFIHGVTELFAVILAGAAGFRIGWRLIFPGARSRTEAMGEAGRQGAVVMFGVVAMLFVAGCLEGIGRQLITDDLARYAIALGSLAAWCSYFYWPRRAR